MAAIITEKFRQSSAKSFKDSFGTDKYYMFVGKSQPWTSEGAASDSLPPAPVDSVAPESYYWDDMLAAKLIGSINTTFAIPRRNYSTSSAFDMYRHDVSGGTTTGNYPSKTTSSSGASSVYDSTFYFLTSTNRVYKVLYNGDQLQTGASNISGSEPTSEQTGPFWHDANYYLKYMYKLTTSEVQNFLTTDFMPVTITANSAANRPVSVVMVTSGGSSYPNGTFYTKVRGDGTTTAIIKLVVSGGTIQEFGDGATKTSMQNAGVGYSFAVVDLAGTNIYSDNTASTLITGSTLTTWNGATAGAITPIIEPTGGHGTDDVKELGGHYVMVQGKFEPSDSDATQLNDFRRVGILKNPNAGGSAASIATARTTNALKLAGTIGTVYQADELITQATTGAQGRVIEFDATNKILYYAQEKYASYGLDTNKNLTPFSTNAAVVGGSSSASYAVDTGHSATTNGVVFVSGYASPELDRDSGEVIYVENRRAISRASDQTEDIKVVVEY
jgi:hypothetical protein